MNYQSCKLLLVEDDENFGMVLQAFLRLNKYEVDWAKNSHSAFEYLHKGWYSLCILDVMLCGEDGFSMAQKIRRIHPEQAFIFLTAKNLKKDILRGYSLGAEDYLSKPFDSEILLLKISRIVNRIDRNATPQEFSFGSFRFNPESRVLSHPENNIKLTPKESELLVLLHNYKGRLLKREYALTRIWANDSYYSSRSMDVFINKLRSYLAVDKLVSIETIHGEGYLFTAIEKKFGYLV